uniref:Tyr recombinase domain-containing protein n=1 Tax=Photinus pyralis TaxID=7054 RepID=A0A1Y1M5M3_PHOPY
MNVYSASVPDILKFFTTQFKKGATHTSLNSFRAALTQILGPELTSDFRIKRFFKGVHSLRPTAPRYNYTWDPSIVLTYVKSMSNETLSLQDLTYKLAILIALATGQRVQTLANIEVENIIINENRVEVKIPKKLKTSTKGRIQPTLLLPFFNQDKKICPARTLIEYLNKTKNLRQTSKNLFITFKKPHKDVTSQTISRWLKVILRKSGLDTNQFTAHSTRHAATSAAARKGVPYDSIRLAAGWSEKSSVFANHYNRPLLQKDNFATTVLSC